MVDCELLQKVVIIHPPPEALSGDDMSGGLMVRSGDTYGKDEWRLLYEGHPDFDNTASLCISLREPTSNYYSGSLPRVTYTDESIYSARMETYVCTTTSYLTTKAYSTGELELSTYSRTDTYADWSYYATTATFNSGRVFYPAWSIEWVKEDNKTLKLPWPTLTSNMLIPTYSGQTLPTDGTYDNVGEGQPTVAPQPPSTPNKVVILIVTVLAAIILFGAAAALWLWRGKRAAAKRAKKEEDENKWRHEQGGEQALELGNMTDTGSTAALDTRPEAANSLPTEGDGTAPTVESSRWR